MQDYIHNYVIYTTCVTNWLLLVTEYVWRQGATQGRSLVSPPVLSIQASIDALRLNKIAIIFNEMHADD